MMMLGLRTQVLMENRTTTRNQRSQVGGCRPRKQMRQTEKRRKREEGRDNQHTERTRTRRWKYKAYVQMK